MMTPRACSRARRGGDEGVGEGKVGEEQHRTTPVVAVSANTPRMEGVNFRSDAGVLRKHVTDGASFNPPHTDTNTNARRFREGSAVKKLVESRASNARRT
jgi:hypothetical protein